MSKVISSETLGSLDRINRDFRMALLGVDLVIEKLGCCNLGSDNVLLGDCLVLLDTYFESLKYLQSSLVLVDDSIRSNNPYDYSDLYC